MPINRKPRRGAPELRGGYLKDIPRPHIRKYPRWGPRLVRISITRYWGIGLHYSASIDEVANPLWNRLTHAEKDPYWEGTERGNEVIGWQVAWDDEEAKGRSFLSPRCLSRYWAYVWVQKIIAEHFQPESDYEFHNPMTGKRWFYKEGD
jgi:hypothetical protein